MRQQIGIARSWIINQPEEGAAIAWVDGHRHLIGGGGHGHIHPVRSAQRISLALQLPPCMIRRP